MKKSFAMQDLDCANCAAKMEAAIKKIEGVNDCSVNFFANTEAIRQQQEIAHHGLGSIIQAGVSPAISGWQK